MKTVIKITTAVLLFLSIQTISQTLQWAYQHTNNNWNYNIGQDIAVDDLGNSYVTGRKYSTGNEDIFTHKINSNGTLLWSATYNGNLNADDKGYAITIDNNGNVYVTGVVRDVSTNYFDIATIKYNSNGVLQWVMKYNGPGNFDDTPSRIAVNSIGDVFVAGTSYGENSNFDYVVLKYNSNGVYQWAYRYNNVIGGWDELNDMKMDINGNIIVTGSSIGTGTGLDYATIKINGFNGNQIWESRYFNGETGNNPDEASSLDISANGDIYVTGKSNSTNGGWDFFTQKYNGSTGAQQWSRRYNGTGLVNTDAAYKITVDRHGNAYVMGITYVGNEIHNRTLVIKYDSFGSEIWTRTHTFNNTDENPKDAKVDTSGNVYLSIETYNNSTYEYRTVKLNKTDGSNAWEQSYATGYDSRPSALEVDNQFNVYVTGQLGSKSGTLKYSQTLVGVHNNNNIANEFKLEQNYPNPFNPSTTISFNIAKQSKVKLTIFDITGREVETLVNEIKNKGAHEILFNASNLSSGTYFYKLETEEYSEVKKMMLIK